MKMLRVGDTVLWRGSFGSAAPKQVKVEGIEIACVDKSGLPVDHAPWSIVCNRSVIVSLDCGNWAYGTQISPV